MMKPVILLVGLLLAAPVLAETYQCPGSYQVVKTGATVKEVVAACGRPVGASQRVVDGSALTNNPAFANLPAVKALKGTALVWSYRPRVTVGVGEGGNTREVTFVGGAVSALSEGGAAVDSMTCKGVTIKKGSPMSAVSTACGLPSAQGSAAHPDRLNQPRRYSASRVPQTLDNRLTYAGSQVGAMGEDSGDAIVHGHATADTLKGKHQIVMLIYKNNGFGASSKKAFVFFDGKLGSVGDLVGGSGAKE